MITIHISTTCTKTNQSKMKNRTRQRERALCINIRSPPGQNRVQRRVGTPNRNFLRQTTDRGNPFLSATSSRLKALTLGPSSKINWFITSLTHNLISLNPDKPSEEELGGSYILLLFSSLTAMCYKIWSDVFSDPHFPALFHGSTILVLRCHVVPGMQVVALYRAEGHDPAPVRLQIQHSVMVEISSSIVFQ